MHRLSWYVIPPLVCAASLLAQSSAVTPTRVSGIVWDSVAAVPLAGATVQLLGDGPPTVTRATRSDSAGRFAFDIPVGRYTIGFLHPALDSLGLEPTLHAVDVRAGQTSDVTLAIPSARRLRAAICGDERARRGLLMGFVRNAQDGAAVRGVPVSAGWFEYTIATREVSGHRSAARDTTRDNGWFALCDLPAPGRVVLAVARGDSTQRIEVEIPAGGFVRRDVYAGAANGEVRYRLSGRVIAAATRQPLRDAEVSVAGGQSTRTDAQGVWALTDAPAGTRMLDVRAMGYYPLHRAVDVMPDAPALDVELLTMRAMLDTIHVTATRLTRNMQEFEQRRRASGGGQFFTHDDIRRLNPVVTTDVFKLARGMEVLAGNGSPANIYMRGIFSKPDSGDRCRPDLWVDGVFLDSLMTADLLDMLTRPEDIAGIEVHRAPFVPPQFSRTLGACGSIVVWTMPPSMPESRTSDKRRLLRGAGIVAGGLLIGVAVTRLAR